MVCQVHYGGQEFKVSVKKTWLGPISCVILNTVDMTFRVEFLVYGKYPIRDWNSYLCFRILEFKDFV